jgi:hypothetical protein
MFGALAVTTTVKFWPQSNESVHKGAQAAVVFASQEKPLQWLPGGNIRLEQTPPEHVSFMVQAFASPPGQASPFEDV